MGQIEGKIEKQSNISRLQKMKEEYKAKMVFGHDVEDFKQWKTTPYWY